MAASQVLGSLCLNSQGLIFRMLLSDAPICTNCYLYGASMKISVKVAGTASLRDVIHYGGADTSINETNT